MKTILSAAAAVLFLFVHTGAELEAQAWEAGLPGNDVGSVTLHVGAIAPTTTLPDGGSFGTGVLGGVSGTFWPFTHIGVRGSFLIGKTNGDLGPNNSLAGQQDPLVWLYSTELALRRPMGGDRFAWFPYVFAGGGGKTYNWSEHLAGRERDFTYAWTGGGGLEIRPTDSPWYGFLIEGRATRSKYKWHALHFDEPNVTDIVVTAGITLNR